MIDKLRSTFLRLTPGRIALLVAGLFLLDSTLVQLQPIEDCRPTDRLYGWCDAVELGSALPYLVTQFAVIFVVVYLGAIIIRTMARPFAPHQTQFERTFSAVFLASVIFGAGIATDRLVIDGIPARSDEFAMIRDAWDLLNFEYVRAADLDPSLLAHAAIGAMTYAVGDTDHTYFATPEELADFNDGFFAPDAAEKAVDWVIVPGTRFALIRIDAFVDRVSDVLAETLRDVRRSRATAIILDLRDNPGGIADEAIWVASAFIESGDVMGGRDAEGVVRTIPVEGPVIDPTTPMVVLIDVDTWSSAEVVASALQDAGRAKLIGKTTFGTGTILDTYQLQDGSELSIGTMEWLTRDGRSVWRVGVEPDVVVSLPERVRPLTPAALSTLDVGGLRRWGDTQLTNAISYLQVTFSVR